MKIAYGSDLHLEFDLPIPDNILKIDNTEKADVLVLAGDVVTARLGDNARAFFDHVSKQFPIVLYIMGNHEHYEGDFYETRDNLVTFLRSYSNIMLLHNECVVYEDVAFFGGTLWTDLKNRDPLVIMNAISSMNDFNYIKMGKNKFHPTQTLIEHDNTMDALKLALATAQASKMVVVSHHAPSAKSCHPRFAGDPTNYAYYTELDEFVMDNSIIKAWIHGHTHDPYDYMIGETRVLCNPRGYIGYQESAKNWQVKYVEI